MPMRCNRSRWNPLEKGCVTEISTRGGTGQNHTSISLDSIVYQRLRYFTQRKMARIPVASAAILCIFLSCIERTLSFNFETRLPVFKEGPENSYFGFSVAEHIITDTVPTPPYSESVILVGAPIYQTDIPAIKPGGVFRCPFTSNASDCTLLELDEASDLGGSEGTGIRDNQWLGVSVVSQGPGGPVAACAHRYKAQPASIEEIQGLGKCYFLTGDLEKDIFTQTGYVPCTGLSRPDNYDGNLYKYCQAGTDLAVSRLYMYSDPSSQFSEYIMGVPGADNWLGGIATSNVPNMRPRNLITPLDYANNGVSYNSYLGFSVASAKLTDGNLQMYVAGAPRSDAKGAVVILKSQADQSPSFVYRINAENPSSSFGYDVTAADLDGDGYDDLIVGAPQYFRKTPEPMAGGRVYIYMNRAHDGTFDGIEPIRLTGPVDSLFGQVVANLRDINLDEKEDIAVGAPYENDGEGAVYIYLGHSVTGISQPEAQKILPSNLPMGINGYPFPNATFGYAISGGIDLDGNGFPDMAIGSYEVQQITILRGRPVINIEHSLELSTTELDPNKTNCEYSGQQAICFTVKLCMYYYCDAPVFDDEITINFDIEAEEERRNIPGLNSRVVFEENFSHTLAGQSLVLPAQSLDESACSPEYNIVVKPGFKDIFRPIPIKLTYYVPEVEAVMPEPGDPLPSITPFPLLNQNIDPVIEREVVFEKECAKDDGVCITDLSVGATLSLEGDPPLLKVGEQAEVRLDVTLANLNEDAYDAKLVITFPVYLGFSVITDATERITFGCKYRAYEEGDNVTTIDCAMGNPYPQQARDSFTVVFDARKVPPDAQLFNITIVSSSTNDADSNPADNQEVIEVEVESITDILISGDGPEQLYFSGAVRGESAMEYFEDIGLSVMQEWTIFNEGPGAVNTAMVTINFPHEVENGKWLLYMTHLPYVENNKGVCNVTPPIYVNELGLRPKPQGVAYNPAPPAAPVNPAGPPPSAPATPQETPSGTRKRRQAVAEPVTSTKELTAGKDIVLDCETGSANCVTIKCNLDPLIAEPDLNEVKIIIKSRLWNSTFLEDYINARSVRVVTKGFVEIESAPYITQIREDNDNFKLSMTVTPDIKTLPPSKPLQWWIILVAVLGGLILLILLIILLWKCGFFERKTGYKYATVTQQQASQKGKMDKTAYYDDMYYN